MSKFFQCVAMGDSMFFEAADLSEAKDMLRAMCGELPAGMVTWKEVSEIPEGEEAADMRNF